MPEQQNVLLPESIRGPQGDQADCWTLSIQDVIERRIGDYGVAKLCVVTGILADVEGAMAFNQVTMSKLLTNGGGSCANHSLLGRPTLQPGGKWSIEKNEAEMGIRSLLGPSYSELDHSLLPEGKAQLKWCMDEIWLRLVRPHFAMGDSGADQ